MATLASLQARLDALQCDYDELSATLGQPLPPAAALKDAGARIPVLDGHAALLQTRVDAVSVGDDLELRSARKALVDASAALGERVQHLPDLLATRVGAVAARYKEEGNDKYKAKQYDAAIRCYTDAIGVDRRNVTFWCNRSACYQAKAEWRLALADAKEAAALNVNAPKAYLFQVKPLLQLGEVQEAAKVLQGAPIALRDGNAELVALSATVQSELKAAGNAAFKAAQHDSALQMYSLAIALDGSQAVYYSNRCAVYQAKRLWREALADASQAIKLDALFVKGHLHLGKIWMQQQRYEEAKEAVQRGLTALQEAGQNSACAPLNELLQSILAQSPRGGGGAGGGGSGDGSGGGSGACGPSPFARGDGPSGGASGGIPSSGASPGSSSSTARAAALQELGTARYKAGDYAEALKLYSQAIGTEPSNGALYGNRAACWMMLSKFERAVTDCAEGLRYEKQAELGKLRGRQATALTRLGKLERAADVLQQGVAKGGEHVEALRAQLQALSTVQAHLAVGRQALDESNWTKAKSSFLKVIAGGVSDEPKLLLLLSKALLALKEPVEAARQAQKALALDENDLEAYVLRADALVAMGLSDKAMRVLREALQRDPDNQAAATKLKKLKRQVEDLARTREAIQAALQARRFEAAAALCTEGLRLDIDDKQVTASFHESRAKAFQLLARSRARGETRREREQAAAAKDTDSKAKGGDGGVAAEPALADLAAGESVPPEAEDDPRAGANACWQRCLQECNKAIYNEATLLTPYLLKTEALQELERWREALTTMEQCLNSEPSRAHDQSVLQKAAEAQFLVKKSEREDLYALLGVKGVGSKASEKEIRGAYKRAALEWHPDKHSDKGEEERKAAEAKFKKLGEALDVLTDEFKRKLWDEGHDLESIEQQVQMRAQGHRH